MDAVTQVPPPRNEPVLDYAPGSLERAALQARLAELGGQTFDLTMTLGGRQRMASGERAEVVQPHPALRGAGSDRSRHPRRREGGGALCGRGRAGMAGPVVRRRFNVAFARQILAEQPMSSDRDAERR